MTKGVEAYESVSSGRSGKLTDAKTYAKLVAEKTKVNGIYSDGIKPSQILKNELHEAGVPYPPYGFASHHIVPVQHPRAKEARDILKSYGIELNSAANGVYLPYETNEFVGDTVLHIGNHYNKYIDVVTEKLNEVVEFGGTKEDIVNSLNEIRAGLLDGSITLN